MIFKNRKKWQQSWKDNNTYRVNEEESKKVLCIDMFLTLLVQDCTLGTSRYIASDIFARYKKLQGFNVLHPMGFDSFGLPTEQYAIQTGIHPEIATKKYG